MSPPAIFRIRNGRATVGSPRPGRANRCSSTLAYGAWGRVPVYIEPGKAGWSVADRDAAAPCHETSQEDRT